ncbi:MAG: cobalamin biosynthesis protein CobW [cyanobacterium endosymbiont of Rhopalodia musculus]|uniref:cobalamin biosynthesis protein CobW n=1 Tax=cyanobacterium endosymbiont of Epithemia clementina EcSB TaxID=3034674 RepID=UPI0024807616|nr:cobalamin biosynthesis protein CobW [cyanobacterium endosymbiont of Epithemia clementina EcSB]WGT67573.1 cobalamin biosynthesis protein CobW [cyanobacterium endosymbiont of Epithemia clementina EcSB]
MHKIPVTVITGFLGAGKTTLVRHLLQHNQKRRIAVLVNEFGEVGIDGELLRDCQICNEDKNLNTNIIELTNGCLCCTVQEEFFPIMQKLLERREDIDCILIETSGLALPKPLVQAFQWPEIRNSATVDGVITVVDTQALVSGTLVMDSAALEAQRKADPNLEHETPIEELFKNQLACADLVLLTKIDLIGPLQFHQVRKWLEGELRLGVKVVSCNNGEINPNVLLGFNAAVEDNLKSRPSHPNQEEDHDHDDDINSVQVVLDQEFDLESLVNQLKKIIKTQEIYRIKGFVNVPSKPMRLVLQGVGNRFDTFYDRPWKFNELRQTRLVFIGRQLTLEEIKCALT